MSIPANFTSFVASASVAIGAPAGGPIISALPPLDSGNTAMLISCAAADVVYITLCFAPAPGSVPSAGPTVRGSIVLSPGQSVLLTTGIQGQTTNVAILAKAAGGAVTFTRGTATNVVSFSTHDDAVIV